METVPIPTVPQIHKLSLVLTRACSIPSMTMTPSMVCKEEWAKVHRLQSRKLAIFLCLTSGRTINLQRNTNTGEAQQDSSVENSPISQQPPHTFPPGHLVPYAGQLPTYMALSVANQAPDHHGPAADFPPGSLMKLLTGLTTFPPSLLGSNSSSSFTNQQTLLSPTRQGTSSYSSAPSPSKYIP